MENNLFRNKLLSQCAIQIHYNQSLPDDTELIARTAMSGNIEFDELVHEGKELGSRGACLAHAQVKGIVQILLVVGAGIEIHGQQVLRRHARTRGVELQLADGDARAVGPKVSETKNAAAVGDANEQGDVAVQVDQRVQLYSTLSLAEAGPREQGQTQSSA